MARDRSQGGSFEFGVAVLDKPRGPSSHELVGWARWCSGQRSVGHCGTLDPAATGVLVLCFGAATRLAPLLTAADKTYDAVFELGCSTDTADAEGAVLRARSVAEGEAVAARRVLEGMRGRLSLPPPAYSAVRVGGRRAHVLARAGEAPELAPRPMAVRELAGVTLAPAEVAGRWRVSARMRVSKGSYVRSLAEALEARCGVPVHLASLRRIASGAIDLDPALGPFSAERLEPTAGEEKAAPRPPRWRVRPVGAGDRRSCGLALAGALLDPLDALGLPWRSAAQTPAYAELLARAAQGQRLGVGEPAVAELLAGLDLSFQEPGRGGEGAQGGPEGGTGGVDDDPARPALALRGPAGDGAGERCALLRPEFDPERGWRLAPDRVLAWGPGAGGGPKRAPAG